MTRAAAARERQLIAGEIVILKGVPESLLCGLPNDSPLTGTSVEELEKRAKATPGASDA